MTTDRIRAITVVVTIWEIWAVETSKPIWKARSQLLRRMRSSCDVQAMMMMMIFKAPRSRRDDEDSSNNTSIPKFDNL